jgi:hypothetical protein
VTETIAEFVAAMYDAEHGDAQLISDGGYQPQRWEVSGCVPDWPFQDDLMEIYAVDRVLGADDADGVERYRMALVTYGRNQDEHIARWDPERICLEIEAKRRILARHARCVNGEGCRSGRTVGRDYCDDVADLAAPYSGHPRFKPEWSVT